MRFLTLSAALLLLGFAYAEEPSLECAMYAETCETLCVLSVGGERAVPKCATEASTCLCDSVDMSDYVNENAVSYINNLSEKDLIQFIDSSYERYAQMAIEASVILPSEDNISQVENPQFNLVLDGIEDAEEDSDEVNELQDQNNVNELDVEEEGEIEVEVEGDYELEAETEVDVEVEDEGAGEGADEVEVEVEVEDEDEGDEEEDEGEDAIEIGEVKQKSTRKTLAREQDPFCQTFVSRCKDDCPAAQSEVTCALEDTDSGYMLACACNGVDISASVYAQVKAESKASTV